MRIVVKAEQGRLGGLPAGARVRAVHARPRNFTGYSAIVSLDGAVLAIPSSVNERSPAFKEAAAACNFGPPVPKRS